MFVTSDEFNVLGKRVERMEAAVANVVRKVRSHPLSSVRVPSMIGLTFYP